MLINNTQCCAVREISGLGGHKTAEAAMAAFCHATKVAFPRDSKDLLDPGAFIVFTGVVKFRNGPDSDYAHHGQEYGQNFAKLIKDHKLGSLRATVRKTNRRNHPDHEVVVWVWAPDMKHLKLWWTNHLATTTSTKKP